MVGTTVPRIACRLIMIVFLIVCYGLSIGPASWLCLNGYGVPVVVLDTVYYPIWQAKRRSTTCAVVVDGYLSHWVALPQPNFVDVPTEPP